MANHYTLRTSSRRSSFFDSYLLPFIDGISSYPRLLLEVILRRNFGYEYFSFASGLAVTFLLFIFPFVPHLVQSLFEPPSRFRYGYDTGYNNIDEPYDYVSGYEIWFVYAALFFIVLIIRWNQVRKNQFTIDPLRSSNHHGDFHPLFLKLKVKGKQLSARKIEIVAEPLTFFIVGYFLNKYGQNLGILFMIAALIYSMAYLNAYRNGDRIIRSMHNKTKSNKDTIEILKATSPASIDPASSPLRHRPIEKTLLNKRSDKQSKSSADEDDITLAD